MYILNFNTDHRGLPVKIVCMVKGKVENARVEYFAHYIGIFDASHSWSWPLIV